MKTITICSTLEQSGVSSIVSTLASHAALNRGLRVLHIDLNESAQSSSSLKEYGDARVSMFTSDFLFKHNAPLPVESGKFVSIPANTKGLSSVSADTTRIFVMSLEDLDERFDLCVIDTPSRASDVRLVSALMASDTAASPLLVTSAGVRAMDVLMNDVDAQDVEFLGFIPNKLDDTDLTIELSKILTPDVTEQLFLDATAGVLAIPKCEGIESVNTRSNPLFKSKSIDWPIVKFTFDALIDRTLGA